MSSERSDFDPHKPPFTKPNEVSHVVKVTPLWEQSQIPVTGIGNKLLVRLETSEAQSSKHQRIPFSIILLIDRSRSMFGKNLARVGACASFLLRHLGERDHLGIITFNEKADITFPVSRMTLENKEAARAALCGILSRGSTDVYTGLNAAIDMMVDHAMKFDTAHNDENACDGLSEEKTFSNPHREIWLFTDGLNTKTENEKITYEKKRDNLKEKSISCPIVLFLLNKSDYQADFIDKVALGSGGAWFTVDNEDAFATTVGYRLGGLLSIQARQISLTLTAMPHVCSIRSSHSAYSANLERSFLTEYEYIFPDLYSGEVRDLIFDVYFETCNIQFHTTSLECISGRLILKYHPSHFSKEITQSIDIPITRSRTPSIEPNPLVKEVLVKQEVAHRLGEISRLCPEQRRIKLPEFLRKTINFIKLQNAPGHGSLRELADSLEGLANICSASSSSSLSSLEGAGITLANIQHGLLYQRSSGNIDSIHLAPPPSSAVFEESKLFVSDIIYHETSPASPLRAKSYSIMGKTQSVLPIFIQPPRESSSPSPCTSASAKRKANELDSPSDSGQERNPWGEWRPNNSDLPKDTGAPDEK